MNYLKHDHVLIFLSPWPPPGSITYSFLFYKTERVNIVSDLAVDDVFLYFKPPSTYGRPPHHSRAGKQKDQAGLQSINKKVGAKLLVLKCGRKTKNTAMPNQRTACPQTYPCQHLFKNKASPLVTLRTLTSIPEHSIIDRRLTR